MLRHFIHYGIHFIVPIAIGLLFFKDHKLKVILIFLAAICIDLDHFIANPVFDPNRCSVGFHPLHSYWAVGFYFLLIAFKKTRLFGFALLLHILADILDCSLM